MANREVNLTKRIQRPQGMGLAAWPSLQRVVSNLMSFW